MMGSKGRGVLDRPVKPDDDGSLHGSEATKQSILPCAAMDCFASARNDDLETLVLAVFKIESP
jgi:hypothetical protein